MLKTNALAGLLPRNNAPTYARSGIVTTETTMTLDRAATVIESGIERGLHIGAQLYVSLDGKRVADLAFGLAREGVAMTPDTIMLWMSSTKPITALAIAQIWERGKIALAHRVAKYIPAFGVRGKESITIRHVLTHTGGFRFAVGEWSNEPWEQIIAQICDAELEPGWIIGRTSGYHISSGWYLLGEIIRRVCADGLIASICVRKSSSRSECTIRGSECHPIDGAHIVTESHRYISARPSSVPSRIAARHSRTALRRLR